MINGGAIQPFFCGPKRTLSGFQKISDIPVNVFILSPASVLPGCSRAQVPPPAGPLRQDASLLQSLRPDPSPTPAPHVCSSQERSASPSRAASSPAGTAALSLDISSLHLSQEGQPLSSPDSISNPFDLYLGLGLLPPALTSAIRPL